MEPFFEQHEPYDAWMSVNTFTSAQEADLRPALPPETEGRLASR